MRRPHNMSKMPRNRILAKLTLMSRVDLSQNSLRSFRFISPLLNSKIQRNDNDENISIGAENDPVVIATEWSPLGLSRMYGCVLAVLDSHHRVSIWESTGVGTNENWVPVQRR
jgi:hypothetical protein